MIGETLSHYRITGRLGSGGMGEVYRATDTKLEREVALKMLPKDMARDVVRLERFSREARSVAALNHPNIVTIYSVEEAGGTHFITMELVEGQTLDHLIAEGGLSLKEIFDLAVPLADALSCAHEKGIVHRDLKPANVMITGDGRIKVLDFGLAKLQGTDSDLAEAATVSRLLTQDGAVMGTYPYMSPEQVEGKQLDQRTDLFSLGTILYELAVGRRPFSGDSAPALMSSILRDPPPPLSEIRPDLPRHLGRILRRCLEKDPRDRYQSARSICNELKSLRIETTDGSSGSSTARRQAPLYERPWILVTGFKVSGADPEMRDFAEGLAEDITAGLSRFGYLSVVARESALSATEKSVSEMRDNLGARYVIEGSVRKSGSIVRVGARLVDSRSGASLWAETYTRDMTSLDIFSVQDDITGRVVATVADGYGVLVRSMIDAIDSKPAEELNPSEWVLRMFDYLLQYTAAAHAALREGIEQAVKRYPRDSDVWAVVAQAYLNEWNFGFDPKPDSLDRALAAAEKAVDLDRTNPLAYQLLAQVHFFRRDLVRFRAASDRAISLNPLDTNTVGVLGLITAHTGEFERGAELTRKAMELNPHHAGWYHFGLIWLHFSREEYEQALEWASHVNMPGMFWTYLAIAAICGHLGRQTEGREAVRKLLEIDPEFAAHARHNIESWHFASGLMEPLLDGLQKAGLTISGHEADQPAAHIVDEAPASVSGVSPEIPVPAATKRPGDETVAIAVLPFKDMSPGKDQDYLCEGMAEEVMNALGQIAGIRVASRTSAFRAGQVGQDLPAIGRALHVGHVLEGSVRTAGDRLRVTAQLIDVESGYQLWSERYDRDASDIFAMQDEIAQSVVEVVKAKLSPGTSGVRQRQQVSNLDAYRHYLKGRYYRYTKNDHGSAVKEYERAIELDPSYGPSWVGLAEVRVLAAGYGLIPVQKGYADAREALARANELQGESAEALYVEGMLEMSQRDWEPASSILSRAAELRPDHVQTLCWIGFYWSIMQRPAEARRWFDLAREVDPLGSYPFAMTGCGLSQMCRYEEAQVFLKKAVALDPENTLALWACGMAMAGQGNVEEAIPLLERAADKARRGAHILGVLGWGLALAGRTSEAEAILAELNGWGDDAPTVVPKAWLLAALGDKESAWQAIERAERECQMMLLFVGMPGFGPLSNDPRYDALLHRMGLPRPPHPSQPEAASETASPSVPPSTAGDAMPRSLAVLPLANLSGDPEQEYFVAGMHDALINELARISALTVISRTSTIPFKNSSEPLPEIAAKLGVDAVIEGSILKAGDRVRINLQLVNARPERNLWADSFDGAARDILEIHGRVAGEVSKAVRAKLTTDEKERLQSQRKVDPRVYEIYLRARHLSYVSFDENVRGIKLYEQAINLDPKFSLAYAGMARNLVYQATLGSASPHDVLQKAAEAARQAIALDPESGEARSIHGYVTLLLEWDWQTAIHELKRAREMEPNNISVLNDSILILALTGSADEAAGIADHASELDPMSPMTLFWRGWSRFLLEQYPQAIEIFKASMEADPTLPYGPLWTGAAYGMMGEKGKATEWARHAERLEPESRNTDFLAVLGATYVMGGQPDETRRILRRVESLERDAAKFPTQRGYLHGWLGEYDQAVECYTRSFAERNPGVIFLANHPVCDVPRSDPRIVKMVEGMGFPAIRPMISVPGQPSDNAIVTQGHEPQIGAAQSVVTAADTSEKSVAVLPFVNMSSDPEQDYFADGLAEELLNLLAKVPDLRVAARTSAFAFKGKDKPVREIAEILNVNRVLEGSVRKAGNKVRITAQLVQAGDGYCLWSETWDRELEDVFAVQDEIARAVVDKLEIDVTPADVPTVRPVNPEAYNAMLMGRHLVYERTREAVDQAIDCLGQAVEIMPDYVDAWIELGRAHYYRATGGWGLGAPIEEEIRLAQQALDRALELDSASPDVHEFRAWLAWSHDWDWPEADRAIRRALEAKSASPRALNTAACIALTLGRSDESLAIYESAIRLDPLNMPAYNNLALAYYYVGRLDDAEAAIRRAIALSPNASIHRFILGRIHLSQGRLDAARGALEMEINAGARQAGIALVLDAEGRREEADKMLEQMRLSPDISAFDLATAYGLRGDADQAFEWLEKSREERDGNLCDIRLLPEFRGLSDDPRWEPFLESLGLSDRQIQAIGLKPFPVALA
ncbi:MAG: hypothetical protein AMJ59_05400 [Gammaproteobacteria bacterium SG8_31]|jgi:TolB-like protein/Flp pilus assembly protein TadD|nr:MAG: hypothetical protein AMJ59_05400 [Gammaproteobacteria bacterium SG8_31]